jgi:hypothetical protein
MRNFDKRLHYVQSEHNLHAMKELLSPKHDYHGGTKPSMKPIIDDIKKSRMEGLANGIAIVLLDGWLAIEDGKTRLQSAEYQEQAQELADYLTIIGYGLAIDTKINFIKYMEGICPHHTKPRRIRRLCTQCWEDVKKECSGGK